MLFLIGAGLTPKDISIGAIEVMKSCSKVFIENYTSFLGVDIKTLENTYGVKIEIASRNFLEATDEIITLSLHSDICLLVIGTPLFATTHTDILLRAKKHDINVKLMHNSSILNVFGCAGLYSYSFGRTISIPFFDQNWKPTSFYMNIYNNTTANLHTLCLLDIRVDEKTAIYMTPNVAIEQLLICEDIERRGIFLKTTNIFVVSRFGREDEKIHYGTVEKLKDYDFGAPLHSIIIPANLDILEKEHIEELFGGK